MKKMIADQSLAWRSLRAGGESTSTLLTVLILMLCICTRVLGRDFQSGIINLDYDMPGYGYLPYGPGAALIGSAGDFWNQIDLLEGSGLALTAANGTQTSVVWSYYPWGNGQATPLVRGTYASLFDVTAIFYSASLSGLTPNQPYSLILFTTYGPTTVAVNGVTFSTPGVGVREVDSLIDGEDYDRHTVIADSTGTLSFTSGYGEVSSWQLTTIPEPSPLELSGVVLAACGLTWLMRREDRKRVS